LADLGVVRILYTDISRDGTLAGPNLAALRTLVAGEPRLKVLASGGVAGLDDLRALARSGAEGAIIGTALYDGRLTLDAVLAAC
jgi:phosphoribosylformimino-5-aminoimidazole carboxamide ribotide isomerase